jgi:hydrogenase large subunit
MPQDSAVPRTSRSERVNTDISAQLLADVARTSLANTRDVDEPFRQIAGTLEIHCTVDLAAGRVTEAASVATRFRGYEALLLRRDLRDAGLVSSTASGICGGVHATASSQCLEMALGVKPPPLGIVARNLLLSCQYLSDNPMHLFVLGGPDYSEQVIAATNPEIWAKAEGARARHESLHGYQTIAELLRALNRSTGALFIEALRMVGRAREAYAVLGGKFPHSESIIVGGVALDLNADKIETFARKITPLVDYAKKCAAVWDEVFDFLLEANPLYLQLGESPPDAVNMVDFGQWDHEDVYDATYARCDEWGQNRWSTPGAVIGGQLVTTRLTELNLGLEDDVDHSFYDFDGVHPHAADPLGNPLGPRHPWNRSVQPNPTKQGPPTPYSWASAMTWRGRSFEVGAYARLYLSALAKQLPPSDLLESTGHSLRFHLPAGELPARDLEWRVPPIWNAFERNRARAYAVAFNLSVTLENVERARALYRVGATELSTPFAIPPTGRQFGAGFCGAGRGFLAHWAVIEDGRFSNYQIVVPSRLNAGPRTPRGELGPIEQALTNTPLIESRALDPGEWAGIDVIRTIQSFDPCMTCSAHIRVVADDQAECVVDRTITTSGP